MKNYFSFLFAALLLAAVSCQQDEILTELEDNNQILKSYVKVDDTRWEITAPDIPWEKWKGMLSLPGNWNNLPNRYLVFYAHGMVDPDEGIELPNDFVAGKSIEKIVNDMGMGYATTSYSANGLIAFEAVKDIEILVAEVNKIFDDNSNPNQEGYLLPPDYIFLGGPSEGGLVTVLTIERNPDLFDGALSICGPIGDFYKQLQYNGDFHVLFNYFLGAELGKSVGNPADGVTQAIMDDWKTGDLKLDIQGVMAAYPSKVTQLLKCAKVTVDMNDPVAMGTAVLECLRFNVMLTNDVTTRLQGVPFNNKYKWYRGSDNDWKLNRYVQRVLTPDYYTAKNNVKKYQTSGKIEIPVVTIHTTGDHVTPFWHNPAYRLKTFLNGNSLLHSGIPVANYGHCTIEESHLVAGLAILIVKTNFMNLFAVDEDLFTNQESLESFKQIMKDNSVEVQVN